MRYIFFILFFLFSTLLLKASEGWNVYIPDESFSNYITELKWKAIADDHVAEYKLGLHLRQGVIAPIDLRNSEYWFSEAEKGGFSVSNYSVTQLKSMGIGCQQPDFIFTKDPDIFFDTDAPLTGEEISELIKLKTAGQLDWNPNERDLRVYDKWLEVNNLFDEYARPQNDSKIKKLFHEYTRLKDDAQVRTVILISIVLLIITAVIFRLKIRKTSVSNLNLFFSLWWKSTLIFLAIGALIGFLSAGNYGLGRAIGGGLIIAPLAGLFYGGIIWLFKR